MRCPGSTIAIDREVVKGKQCFRRIFVALKPCVDGFLNGCRPFLSIDSTVLTGKFRGQLATACAIDGLNWMFPVVYGVIESESTEGWEWFMERLKEAIRIPPNLAICTDAGKGICEAVSNIFPQVEHRECMRHLVINFRKKFVGKVFDDHLWPAAYSWTQEDFETHMAPMEAARPDIKNFFSVWHKRLWSRSKFGEGSKVDYVTNNLAECFNNWIKKYKCLLIVDLLDKIRRMLMIKFRKRRRVGYSMAGIILPSIMSHLNEKSRNLHYDVESSSNTIAEVSGKDISGHFRHIVDLAAWTCTCRRWQVTGLPCFHAIAFITSLPNNKIADFVHPYYTVEKFKLSYAGVIPPLTDQAHWPKVNLGFRLHPPILRRTAGRPKIQRYKGSHEGGKKRAPSKCSICQGTGHRWRTCKRGQPDVDDEPKKKRRRNKKTSSVAVSNQLEGGTSNVAESNQLQVVESNVDASNTLEGA